MFLHVLIFPLTKYFLLTSCFFLLCFVLFSVLFTWVNSAWGRYPAPNKPGGAAAPPGPPPHHRGGLSPPPDPPSDRFADSSKKQLPMGRPLENHPCFVWTSHNFQIFTFPKSCCGTREPLNLHNSGYRATPELRIGRLDWKFHAASFYIGFSVKFHIFTFPNHAYSIFFIFPKSCCGTRQPLNLHNSGYRATPELRIGRLDWKFHAASF